MCGVWAGALPISPGIVAGGLTHWHPTSNLWACAYHTWCDLSKFVLTQNSGQKRSGLPSLLNLLSYFPESATCCGLLSKAIILEACSMLLTALSPNIAHGLVLCLLPWVLQSGWSFQAS